MKEVDDMAFKKIEKEVVNGLLEIFKNHAVKIILYGSVARNEDNEESDIDIAVIVDTPVDKDTRDTFLDWCAEMDLKYDCVLSIIDIEQQKYEQWEKTLPFYRNVSKEGIVLWTAA